MLLIVSIIVLAAIAFTLACCIDSYLKRYDYIVLASSLSFLLIAFCFNETQLWISISSILFVIILSILIFKMRIFSSGRNEFLTEYNAAKKSRNWNHSRYIVYEISSFMTLISFFIDSARLFIGLVAIFIITERSLFYKKHQSLF